MIIIKILVFSDIHGSYFYAKEIEKVIQREYPDKIILLGDLYYHGPRNSLSEEYDPIKVADILNKYVDRIIAVKGNCDAEVDEMISKFKLEEQLIIEIANKRAFISHGHKYNKDSLPEDNFQIMFCGHTHVSEIIEIDGKLFVNPGSLSLPKDSHNSYCLIDDNKIMIKDIVDDAIIDSISI